MYVFLFICYLSFYNKNRNPGASSFKAYVHKQYTQKDRLPEKRNKMEQQPQEIKDQE